MQVLVLTIPIYRSDFCVAAIEGWCRRGVRGIVFMLFGRLLGRNVVTGPSQVDAARSAGSGDLCHTVCHNPIASRAKFDLICSHGLDALYEALALKKSGLANIVIGGPNICADPADLKLESMMEKPDFFVQPCAWAKHNWLAMAPDFPVPIIIGIAGVDVQTWKPSGRRNRSCRALIYDKILNARVVEEIKVALSRGGISSHNHTLWAFSPFWLQEAFVGCCGCGLSFRF